MCNSNLSQSLPFIVFYSKYSWFDSLQEVWASVGGRQPYSRVATAFPGKVLLLCLFAVFGGFLFFVSFFLFPVAVSFLEVDILENSGTVHARYGSLLMCMWDDDVA